ncbi:MAG: type II toxin-antitoxin system RelE/ParE family toxin [Candidatus Acidiferrales bacterium]
MKEAILHPAARAAIRLFPYEVRRALGKAIFDLQQGEILPMPLSRPMPSVGAGAAEIRIADRTGIYRAFYYVRSARRILVFHAFVKKSQATPKHEMDLGKKRLKEMLNEEN